MSDHLFVYGTLIPGCEPKSMRAICQRLQHVGPATIRGKLFDLGSYPAIVLDSTAGVIRGEVLAVDSQDLWDALDAYEGCPLGDRDTGLFRRVRCQATLESGETLDCWTYIFARDLQGATQVESGCWRTHKKLV